MSTRTPDARNAHRAALLLYVVSLGAAPSACGNEATRTPDSRASPSPTPTARPAVGQLPAGHPPVSSGDASVIPPPKPGGVMLRWRAPEGWVSETPGSAMRKAQYRVPGKGGDAECVVYYFGPGQGGDAMSNANRWASQFTAPKGASLDDRVKTSTAVHNGLSVLTVEVSGTYRGGMGSTAEEKPGYMLLGAIVQAPDANWFFKFTGPQATVAASRAHSRG